MARSDQTEPTPPTPAIPDFDANGNLPPGIHKATLSEIRAKLAWNTKRQELLDGLARAIQNLAEAGVKRVWIGGGFVSDKEEPSDVDGCWDDLPGPVDVSKLDNVFLDTRPPRERMKSKYGVDFLIARRRLQDPEAQGGTVLDFFQKDSNGNAKGVLLIEG
ncbi:MAG: hypothetical protein HQ567_30300 [Candidatus Nealsonbacteria bacterium]|nr:hypothetical protein [Candidatus Nealsonbacteria bacterium]